MSTTLPSLWSEKTKGGDSGRAYRVFMGRVEEKNNLKDLGVDGRKILKLAFKKWDGSMDWIDLTEDRDK